MNAYEIRAKMVELAQDYLQKQFELNKQVAEATWQEMLNAGKQLGDYKDLMPKMYTPEDILAQAQKLYKFVSDVRPAR